jgi:SPP1 gp7 family putative phage head morphogenesis protein
MGDSCCLHINAELRRDPTRTTTLRNKFEAEAYRRFRKLKGMIRKELVDMDGLGLKNNRGRFGFPRPEEKVAAFMDWLRMAQRDEILGVSEGVPLNQAARQAWTRVYVESAYNRGVVQAAAQMRGGGAQVSDRWVQAAFNRPIHADRLGLAYTRTFSELEGITQAMDQQISRTLAEGIGSGNNPVEIARAINNRVDKIGITRARALARTEVISAHAEASINSYEEAGIEGVEVVAEFATAGDGLVCPECQALEGVVRPLDEARGVIPVHVNCRCAWIPKIENGSGIELV